jgi:predicted ATP-grasp superfamily ATP-dependent carboligase
MAVNVPMRETAIVIGVQTTIGLSTVRSLGRRGIRCVGVSHRPRGVGLYSKYLAAGYVVPYSPEARDRYVDRIADIATRHGARGILCHHEDQMLVLDQQRARFGGVCELLFPECSVLHRCLDKPTLLCAAQAAGLRVPFTSAIGSVSDAKAASSEVPFPAILKPRGVLPAGVSSEWRVKSRYFADRIEWDQFWNHASDPVPPLIVQQFVRGRYIGLGLAVHNRQAVASFQWTALREYEAGLGALRVSMPPNRALVQSAVALCNSINYEGVCEVEFRGNADEGSPMLMEVNPRLWGGVSLPVACGVDFPLLAYQIYSGRTPTPVHEYKAGIVSRNLSGDLRWLVGGALRGKYVAAMPNIRASRMSVLTGFLSSVGRARVYDLEDLDDPMPGLRHHFGRLMPGKRWQPGGGH